MSILGLESDGTYAVGAAYPMSHPADVAIADLDDDHDLDLAVVGVDGLHILRAGDGDFVDENVFPDHDLRQVKAVDLDGDGILDLLVATARGPSMVLLRGIGQGRYEARELGVSNTPFVVDDFDEDGHLDIATPSETWLARAGGTFDVRSRDRGIGTSTMVSLDFDHDGHRDLVTAQLIDDVRHCRITSWIGDGHGGFVPTTLAERALTLAATVGDLDRDGYDDVVESFDGTTTFLANHTTVTTPSLVATDLSLVDLDRDGDPDLVYATLRGVGFARGLGDGRFAPLTQFVLEPEPSGASAARPADLDGDGSMEIVFVDRAALQYP